MMIKTNKIGGIRSNYNKYLRIPPILLVFNLNVHKVIKKTEIKENT